MAGTRSPNYPNHNLGAAIELARKIFDKDGRIKMSRLTIAMHLGHEVASGPALGKIGALRAYGLIVGTGDELRVSDDAIAALKAPEGSNERNEAILRLANNPPLFQDIRKEKGARPSKENLIYWLIQEGFSSAAASIAAGSYLETQTLVDGLGGEYGPEKNDPSLNKKDKSGGKAEKNIEREAEKVRVMNSERELITGMLSKSAGFRLIVTGSIGAKEIERLIAKLELDKEILAEPDIDTGPELEQ